MAAKSLWSRCEKRMTEREKLQHRESERDLLLQGITKRLESDRRIVAAWLFGSIGRGEQDALSDLDIFAIVDDAHIASTCEARREFVAAFGSPVCIVEAPQNAPRGGAYLMALYAGETGPHQVDWYWQARSRAKIPQQTVLLFDKVGLPRDDKPTTFEEMNPPQEWDRETAIANTVCSFWAMLLITAKYAVRSPNEERMGLLPYVQNSLREAAEFAGVPLSEVAQELPHPTFAEKVTLFQRLAVEMGRVMVALGERSISVPKDILPQAETFLEFIKNTQENSRLEERA